MHHTPRVLWSHPLVAKLKGTTNYVMPSSLSSYVALAPVASTVRVPLMYRSTYPRTAQLLSSDGTLNARRLGLRLQKRRLLRELLLLPPRHRRIHHLLRPCRPMNPTPRFWRQLRRQVEVPAFLRVGSLQFPYLLCTVLRSPINLISHQPRCVSIQMILYSRAVWLLQ